ncbi:MAG: endonuclease/exonuclease/phosphatase family protein [Thermoleophilaceae bacterium]|nr:endonuclease/exonuclease/phosphatase family protein [Thermoleophilaceae bacterium]
MNLRLVTWSVNSLRARLPRLRELLAEHGPDIVCLQETKSEADDFPHAELAEAGYDASTTARVAGRVSRCSPAARSPSASRRGGWRASRRPERRAGSRPRSTGSEWRACTCRTGGGRKRELRCQARLPRRGRRAGPRAQRAAARDRRRRERHPHRPRRLRHAGLRRVHPRHERRAHPPRAPARHRARRRLPPPAPRRGRLHVVGLPGPGTSTAASGCGSTSRS